MRILACLAVVVLLVVSAPGADADGQGTHYKLENGLDVWLRPVPGATDVAVCVLYDVGEVHDPEKQSGLAHLVEHCYVTAAAGDVPPRTAGEMMAAYPRNWNAQTGARYTVFAFIVPAEQLEGQVREAALRMGDLRITEADLEREVPRVRVELSNMFDRFPTLAGRNRARERVRPSPRRGRKGGVPEDVAALPLDVVQTHHAKYYKPKNARLVVAGAFDVEQAKGWVAEHFAKLPPGESLPEAGEPGTPDVGEVFTVRATGTDPAFPGHLAVAYAAPAHTDAAFPAFVVLVGRLFAAQTKQTLPDGIRATWAPLDEPDVLYVEGPMKEDESPADAETRIRGVVTELAAKAPGLVDRALARQRFAHMLATVKVPDVALQGNPYLLAFGVARRLQMGLDGEALGKALLAVDEAAFRRMADEVLSKETSAAVAVTR